MRKLYLGAQRHVHEVHDLRLHQRVLMSARQIDFRNFEIRHAYMAVLQALASACSRCAARPAFDRVVSVVLDPP